MPEHDDLVALHAACLAALGIPFSFRFSEERGIEITSF